MSELDVSDFPAFFEAIHEYPPMDWQVRLAERACHGDWPEVIDLPTGAGKTSCLDIATFALAYQADRSPEQRTAPLRTYLVVDRRIVVDDAYRRALKIQKSLANALSNNSHPVLTKAARRLATISGDETAPIVAYQLRGGIYRDMSWARSSNQPLLVTSTVDQVGSRLLFRGYGVSDSSRPIHAALVACDSLILLDEAHCSKAFAQTLRAVRNYQSTPWLQLPLGVPSISVEMTATPSEQVAEERKFSILKKERSDRESLLGRRLHTPKPTELRIASKAKGKNAKNVFAAELVAAASGLLSDDRKAIAIVVNRIETAKEIYRQLHSKLPEASSVELMIGRMRPIDRDRQSQRLRKTIASDANKNSRPTSPLFVVATQCIEVGADLDFDAMVSEAAPLDALRQRFGRLNRTARQIEARGIVVIQEENRKTDEQLDALESSGKQDDPVYGNSLARAWNAIWRASEGDDAVRHLEFGIAAMEAFMPRLGNEEAIEKINTTNRDAPILLPSHLDLLCQTSPAPWPDPDVSLWLHGLQRSNPDVLVCWRADLPVGGFDESKKSVAWTQAVSLCPPSSIECMPVPIGKMKRWLAQQELKQEDDSDIPAAEAEALDAKVSTITEDRQPLLWRGVENSSIAANVNDIHPGDTLVLPVSADGWNELGFIPKSADASQKSTGAMAAEQSAAIIDVAEEAYFTSRRRRVARLFPERLRVLPSTETGKALIEFCEAESSPLSIREVRQLILDLSDETDDHELCALLRSVITAEFSVDRYFGLGGAVAQEGIVLKSCKREFNDATIMDDDGADGLCERTNGRVTLADHLSDVETQVAEAAKRVGITTLLETLLAAARMHDWGKCDPRFQAMLIRRDLQGAYSQPHLWAKSGEATTSRRDWEAVRNRAGLPRGFRHEFLSVQLAEQAVECAESAEVQLTLHLIASHHGYARPFAPVCEDPQPIDVQYEATSGTIRLSREWRDDHPPERLDSGIADRFWQSTRRFGWWGVAYLETILRLADQQASAHPGRIVGEAMTTSEVNS